MVYNVCFINGCIVELFSFVTPGAGPNKGFIRIYSVYIQNDYNRKVQDKNFITISHETDKQEESRQWSKY